MLELSSALFRQRPRHLHLFDAQTSISMSRTNRTVHNGVGLRDPGPSETASCDRTSRGVAILLPRKCQNGWCSYAAWGLYAASALPDGHCLHRYDKFADGLHLKLISSFVQLGCCVLKDA